MVITTPILAESGGARKPQNDRRRQCCAIPASLKVMVSELYRKANYNGNDSSG